MVNKLLFRSFIVVNTSLGIYGFSRGYRAETKYEKESNYNKLISETGSAGLPSKSVISALYLVSSFLITTSILPPN